MEILKVSSKSNPSLVAGAISGVIREAPAVEVQAIGAGAVNQAVKAVIIAKGFLAPVGIELSFDPSFVALEVEGEERTAIRIVVEKK
ncbi:MAG: stage V sporulation protein S [Ruminococcaceae bacterium]|nr:stage V sporulation protein S [Oscillospiraceae bacterium]